LQTVIAGGSWDQLPAESVLSLSHKLGNSVLLSLYLQRSRGPERQTRTMPHTACAAAPAVWEGEEPQLSPGPDFSGFSPLEGTAALEI